MDISKLLNREKDFEAQFENLRDIFRRLSEENARLRDENNKIKKETFKDEVIAELQKELEEIKFSSLFIPVECQKKIFDYQEKHCNEFHKEYSDFTYEVGLTYLDNYITVKCDVKNCKCKKDFTVWF